MQRWMQSAAGGTSQRLKPGLSDGALAIEKTRSAHGTCSGVDSRHCFSPLSSTFPALL